MKSSKETLILFFIIWGVVLILNQAVIFGGCFAPYCIVAAIPHTAIISIVFTIFIVRSEIKEHDEQQKEEPILNTEIGYIFRDKLEISKVNITWNETIYAFDKISKIAWWITDSDFGQLQFGNLYTIVFGNEQTTVTIKTKRETLYDEILKRLLPTVEKNITENMIQLFKRGDGKIYNNATIWDDGIEITKKGGWFTSDTKKKFVWNEVNMYKSNLSININSIKDDSFIVSIDYNFFNIKILEKLLDKIVQNKNATKISDLFEDKLAMEFWSNMKRIKKKKLLSDKIEIESNVQNSKDFNQNLQSIENPSFEKIRRYCNNLADENNADEMQEYLAENGKMYKAIIYDALEQFITQIDGETLTIVDWGCSQGIASMLVLDYIREKQLDIDVAKVILIDDDDLKLNRAIIQTKIFTNDATEILKLNIQDDTINDTIEDIFTDNVLNLFANDKENVHPESLNDRYADQSYFMCVSSQDNETIDNIQNEIEMMNDIRNISNRDGKIGKFQRYERIFQVKSKSEYQVPKYRVPIIDIDDDEIPF